MMMGVMMIRWWWEWWWSSRCATIDWHSTMGIPVRSMTVGTSNDSWQVTWGPTLDSRFLMRSNSAASSFLHRQGTHNQQYVLFASSVRGENDPVPRMNPAASSLMCAADGPDVAIAHQTQERPVMMSQMIIKQREGHSWCCTWSSEHSKRADAILHHN